MDRRCIPRRGRATRRLVCALLLLVVFVPAVSSGADRGGDSPKRVQAAAQASSGRLHLRNVTWDSVIVEVRSVSRADCSSPGVTGRRTIVRGKVLGFANMEHFCWRREATPGSGANEWTEWKLEQLPNRGLRVVRID